MANEFVYWTWGEVCTNTVKRIEFYEIIYEYVPCVLYMTMFPIGIVIGIRAFILSIKL